MINLKKWNAYEKNMQIVLYAKNRATEFEYHPADF